MSFTQGINIITAIPAGPTIIITQVMPDIHSNTPEFRETYTFEHLVQRCKAILREDRTRDLFQEFFQTQTNLYSPRLRVTNAV